MTLFRVAKEISRSLAATFLRDATAAPHLRGFGSKFQDPTRPGGLILFYEYFHGDNGPASVPATRPGGQA